MALPAAMADMDVAGRRGMAAAVARRIANTARFGAIITPIEHHEGKGRKKRVQATGMLDVHLNPSGSLTYLSHRAAEADYSEIVAGYEEVLHLRRQPLIEGLRATVSAATSAGDFEQVAASIETASFMSPKLILQQQQHWTVLALSDDLAVRLAGDGAEIEAASIVADIERLVAPKREACLRELRALLDTLITSAFT